MIGRTKQQPQAMAQPLAAKVAATQSSIIRRNRLQQAINSTQQHQQGRATVQAYNVWHPSASNISKSSCCVSHYNLGTDTDVLEQHCSKYQHCMHKYAL